MSELLTVLRARVDQIVKPHVDVYGDSAPVVKMALRVLAEAEAIEAELGERRVTTERAAELTGWAKETLQARARAKLGGQELPGAWSGLVVEKTPSGYAFVISSIPENPRAA